MGDVELDPEDQARLAQILRRLRDGEPVDATERAWVDATSQPLVQRVHRFCARTLAPERAEDAAHEAWALMLAKIEDFDPRRGDLQGWLFGFARRTCAALHRQRRSAIFEDDVLDPSTAVGGTYRVLKHRIREQVLRAAAAGLDEAQQVLLILRYADDLPVRAIAEALDIPETTAHHRLRELRAHFEARIAEELRRVQLGSSLFKTTI